MKNLKLSAISCFLMFSCVGVYAQSSNDEIKDDLRKPAKTMVNKMAVDSVLNDVNNKEKVKEISLPKPIIANMPHKNEDVKSTINDGNNTVEDTIEPIKKSSAIISSDTYVVNKKEESIVDSAVKVDSTKEKDPNRDYELEARLRKLFIVSDFMMESPYEYGGYLILRDGVINNVCDFKKPNTFYMIAHEGGEVNQLSSSLISAKQLTSENEDEYYHQWNKDLNTIKEKCLNSILGPTVDVNFGERSYSQELNKNMQITLPIVSAIERKGLLPVLRHFPGDMIDCEAKFTRKDVRSCPQGIEEINEQWKSFKPENYPAIMVSNHVYEKVSPLPAVMNSEIHSYLRGKLGYKGLVMTDVLWEMSVPITPKTMWEIFKYNDLMMLINPQQVEAMIPYLVMAIKQMPNGIGEQMLQEKEKRIDKAKKVLAQ